MKIVQYLLMIVLVIMIWIVGTLGAKAMTRNMDTLRRGFVKVETRPRSPGRYIPILMYHHIRERAVHEPYSVSPKIFDEQLAWLRDHNYHVIRYADFYATMTGTTTLPKNPVVITFDDGDRDQYTNAFPILQKYGYSALFYITTNFVGHKYWMTWKMLKELVRGGMEVGGHTLSHPNLTNLPTKAAVHEVEVSKRILENNLHIPIHFFAYPGGAHSPMVERELKDAGYLSAATTRHSVHHPRDEDLYLVPRIHIDDDMVSFAEFVRGERQ